MTLAEAEEAVSKLIPARDVIDSLAIGDDAYYWTNSGHIGVFARGKIESFQAHTIGLKLEEILFMELPHVNIRPGTIAWGDNGAFILVEPR